MYALICATGRYSTMLFGTFRSGAAVPPSRLIAWHAMHSPRKSSVTYGYEIRRLDDIVAIVGKIVAVAIDLAGATIALPDEFRAALSGAM